MLCNSFSRDINMCIPGVNVSACGSEFLFLQFETLPVTVIGHMIYVVLCGLTCRVHFCGGVGIITHASYIYTPATLSLSSGWWM